MATVDIIIPAYNSAKYLPAAIDSVEAQTFIDWQIVLVDDGSTDNTVEVIAPYRERLGAKFTYVKQENRGLPAARNSAIRASSSEYLALLDADDIWLPCRLDESLNVLKAREDAGLSYGLVTFIDAQGNHGTTWNGNDNHISGSVAHYIYTRQIHLPCPTITFRRRCVEDVGYFDETMRASEDRDLWMRIALKYEVAFVPRIIAYYRVSPNSMSTDLDRMLTAQKKFILKHYGSVGCGWRSRRTALAGAYQQRADGQKLRGQWGAALRSILRAMAFNPFDLDNYRIAVSVLFNGFRRAMRRGGRIASPQKQNSSPYAAHD